MNYEHQLKQFLQDYATAIFGSKDIICSIEQMQEEKIIAMYAHQGDKSELLLKYNYEDNHLLDERIDGDEKFYLENNPVMHIENCIVESSSANIKAVMARIEHLFARYCQIVAVNYVLGDLPFVVLSESAPQKELAIYSVPFSNEYRRITLVNSVPFQYYVEIYLPSGEMLGQWLIENIEVDGSEN